MVGELGGYSGQWNCRTPRQELITILFQVLIASHFLLCTSVKFSRELSLQDELFLDREGGGYFNTAGEDPSVLLRVKEDHDGAEPSGNSVSAINLARLASLVGGSKSDRYRQNAGHLLVCCCFTIIYCPIKFKACKPNEL